ncbi:sister chromatid cohesion 1 protein 3 isoform X2 [Hevea brasiliensis]|uniref:sister chromatid cohesion 1 protein 3 isoform X2 n=1 Tax=Hevea brasiliensis TaxID=3981 RepID=UPI0025E3B88D|nr:sister chromatid cohesion 1 protein 3 isoform X2 [Hevea brasiliensis]
MFYSQTFLAKKGPLGTVWCAAHLQHRLKKSHYTSTDISSTVDRIMFPEVPIALRMSGHLLLGVVRIYSKKVDYLYHDCNVILIGLSKAFTSTEVNLPENATTAKFESVTLPQTFDLDALDVDLDIYPDGSPDNHVRSQEEITLQDQIPTGRDPYVVVNFDEDIMMDTLPPEQDIDSGVRPMDKDPINQMQVPTETVDLQDPGPSNHTEEPMDTVDIPQPGLSNQTELQTETLDFQAPGPSNQTELQTDTLDTQDRGLSNQTEVLNSVLNDGNSPPEIEVMRDPGFSSENLPAMFPGYQNDASEPKKSLGQGLDQKEIPSPFKEDALLSGGRSSPFLQCPEPFNSAASQEAPEVFDTRIPFGNTSPELALRSTPPVQQPRPRPRKRKHFFDEATVLTNKFMKKALENSSDISRKRREIPSTALAIWKLNNTLRKEQVFYEPSLTGSSADICNLLNKDFISTKPHLNLEREASPDPRIATSPAPPTEVIPESRDATSPASATEVIPEPWNATSAPATEHIQGSTVAQSPAPEAEPDPEIECLRHHEGHDANTMLPELLPSQARDMTSPGRFVSSPFRRDDFTPSSARSLESEKFPWAGTSTGTKTSPTPDVAASTGTYTTELETPRTFLEEQFDMGHTGLSDIPESFNTAETEDLHFLEADNSPAGSQGTQGQYSLSVRTRAVAQYLKGFSPTTPVSEDYSGDLSLNKILQGKTRKLCARMFFETLVLKSYGLIDVRQDQPFGDIGLKLTSTFSKVQI